MKTFWLVMCIFIFYQEPIACEDWEGYDGTACVCADSQTSRCTDKGGVVCDDMGREYKSVCYFSLEVCSGKVAPERQVTSCGLCNTLRLTDESQPAPQHETFMLEGQTEGFSAVYRSARPDRLSVFFENNLQKWVVGFIHGTSKSVAMAQELYAEYPQDSQGGMLVATPTGNNITWVEKPSLKLECSSESFSLENVTPRRPKRFLPIVVGLVVVAVGATATVTTLNKIQAKKGCLYYPKVCRLRDKLKNELGPEVRRLQSSFRRQYGNVGQYKGVVESVVDVVMDIKDRLVAIRDLHTNLDAGLSQVIAKLGEIPERFPELGDALKNYRKWLEGVRFGAIMSEITLHIEFLMAIGTLLPLMAASVGFFSLASAGLGALATLTFAGVDLVTSIQQEKRVKEDLEKAESKYLKAKTDLNNAFTKMREFQKKFCKTTVRFLNALSEKGKAYHSTFRNLYNFIKGTYQNVPAYCDRSNIYSKSSRGTLSRMKNSYLTPLSNYLNNNEKELKQKIRDVKEMDQFMNQINVKVRNEKKEPSELFNLLKETKPKLAQKQFDSLYNLLLYIAAESLPRTSCYWGRNLALFRSNSLNKNNYLQSPVCKSQEIASLTNKIQQKVSETAIPCSIARLIKGDIFRSKYLVIRYIADHILPSAKCYWGYSLDDVRQNRYDSDIENSKMSSALFNTLDLLSAGGVSGATVEQARNIICGQNQICNRDWQNFLMCTVWKDKNVGQVISCPSMSTGNQCIPPTSLFQSC